MRKLHGTDQRDSSISKECSGLRKMSLRSLLGRWREEGERESYETDELMRKRAKPKVGQKRGSNLSKSRVTKEPRPPCSRHSPHPAPIRCAQIWRLKSALRTISGSLRWLKLLSASAR